MEFVIFNTMFKNIDRLNLLTELSRRLYGV